RAHRARAAHAAAAGRRAADRGRAGANDLLDEARAIGDSYGVNVVGRIVRARHAGRAIVDEAARRNSELIVMGAPRRDVSRLRGRIFGDTVDFVLKNAPSRVLVAAAPKAA